MGRISLLFMTIIFRTKCEIYCIQIEGRITIPLAVKLSLFVLRFFVIVMASFLCERLIVISNPSITSIDKKVIEPGVQKSISRVFLLGMFSISEENDK